MVGSKLSGARSGPASKNWQRGYLHDGQTGITPVISKKGDKDPIERHGVSGGYKIPQEFLDKRKSENAASEAETLKQQRKEGATRSDVLNILGIRDTNHETIDLNDVENKKTLKNRGEIAGDVIESIEKRVDKIRYNREKLIQVYGLKKFYYHLG